MKLLCIITARGGSKRLPNKNMLELAGKPLLVWTVEAAKGSGVLDRIVLTTDSPQIAEIGRRSGIEVPFLRPSELAQDKSTSLEAIKHALEWLSDNEDYRPDWIILLEPSSPGRQPFHIQEVAEIIKAHGANFDSLAGIAKISPHLSPYKALVMDKDGFVNGLNGKAVRDLIHRNQDLPDSYYINSAIYAFRSDNILGNPTPSIWGNRVAGYIMDEKYSIDIDTPEDLDIAEIKIRKLINENN